MRVLIIDDSEVARMIFADMFVSCGHQVVAAAENMSQALAAYRTHKPDLVTLDISMPEADGPTVLKALLQLDARAKVLVISGNSQKNIYDALIAGGACGVLPKPFQLAELKAALAGVAGK